MSLQRKYTLVGGATLLSRLTGFLRDVMIAAVLGASAIADAYIAAFLLPNLFRRVLSEGAFNAAFVPIYARREAEGGAQSAQAFASRALSTLIVAVIGFVLAAEAAMPWIIEALTPGFRAEPGKFADAVTFGRIAFVFVGALIVAALLSSLLNAVGRFSLVALAPLALNLMMIVTLGALLSVGWRQTRSAGLAMVATVLASGFVQLAVVLHGLRRSGLRLTLGLPARDADVKLLMMRILPGLVLAGAGHFNMVVAAQLSSSLPSAVSWLYYADRIFQLPLGFVAAAIGVVLLPEVARALNAGDDEGARAAASRTLEFGLLLVVPAALALAALSGPIIDVIYRHGAFSSADSQATAGILSALGLALPWFVFVKALLPQYLARERIRLPVAAALAGVAVNIVLTWTLIGSWGALAAPVGVAASAFVNAAVLAGGLWVARGAPFDARALRSVPKILAASCLSVGTAYLLSRALAGWMSQEAPFALRAAALLTVCASGVLAHLALISLTGLADLSRLKTMLRKSGPAAAK
jgi:putative peptidoglycan lipid II flippase